MYIYIYIHIDCILLLQRRNEQPAKDERARESGCGLLTSPSKRAAASVLVRPWSAWSISIISSMTIFVLVLLFY